MGVVRGAWQWMIIALVTGLGSDAARLSVFKNYAAAVNSMGTPIPLPRDFFNLTVPPAILLQATMIASVAGCLAVEILGRIRARVNACDEARKARLPLRRRGLAKDRESSHSNPG